VAKVNSIVILSPQDDQVCELLLCVVNSVADVNVHHVRIGGGPHAGGGPAGFAPRGRADGDLSRLWSARCPPDDSGARGPGQLEVRGIGVDGPVETDLVEPGEGVVVAAMMA
jgi:hypothetical protein